MQSKVSMISPCYNKVDYIGAFLDSVIAQKWDNIELILVNDGSSDGTRQVIDEYELKIRKRGYELKVIDQENGGCCKAVHTGLLAMTGDYYCLVDCDDEIDPCYVSHMANWLDTHGDYDLAACNYRIVTRIGGIVKQSGMSEHLCKLNEESVLEKYILRQTTTTVWVYMARVSYLKKCGLIENFNTERRKTYEPLIAVPLLFGGGKLELFNEPLYRYNQDSIDLFRFKKYKDCLKYYEDYLYLYNWSIARLKTDDKAKQKLNNLAKLAYYHEIIVPMPKIPDSADYIKGVANNFVNTINETFNLSEPLKELPFDDITPANLLMLYAAVVKSLIGNKASLQVKNHQRIIAYGVLGRAAKWLLPFLEKTPLKPTELWDKSGDGIVVKKPKFDSLTEFDVVVVLPSQPVVVQEISALLSDSKARVIYRTELNEYTAVLMFPMFAGAVLKE